MSVLLGAEAVTLTYRSRNDRLAVPALDNVSVHVRVGERLGITGPSGSGKSSLLHVLGGLRQPQAGSVLFHGRDLTRLSPAALGDCRRRHFGFVFQQHFLLNYLTVEENILVPAFPGDAGALPRARHLLAFLGLDGLATRFPPELSVGQRQRVAVARALMNRPAVVLADEPTASLDRINAAAVMALLTRYQQEEEAAIVVVTHDPALVEGFDRLLTLRAGRVAAGGGHA